MSTNYLLQLQRELQTEIKKNNWDFKPYQSQKDFLNNTAQYSLFLGPNRAGKTLTGCKYGQFHLTGNYPDWFTGNRFTKPIRMMAVGKTFAQMKEVLVPAYLGSPSREGVIHKTDIVDYVQHPNPKALIKHISGGVSELVFISDKTEWSNLQGYNIHVVHIDEECDPRIIPELTMRTIEVDNIEKQKRIMYWTLCPTLGKTQLIKRFLEQTNENETNNNHYYKTISIDEVLHISEEEKKRMHDSIPEHERAARYYGRPEIGLGLVYPVCRNAIVVPPFDVPERWVKIAGLDFGWRATAVIILTQDPKDLTYYVIDEYKRGELTPSQHVNNFIKKGWDKYIFFYDPAGNQRKQDNGERMADLFKEAGLRNMIKANNSLTGVNKVLELYQSQQLKIFSNNPMLLEELEGYRRNEAGKIEASEDHLLDAKRYVIMTGLDKFNHNYNTKLNRESYNNYYGI